MAASTNTTRIAETPVKNVLTLPQKPSSNVLHLVIQYLKKKEDMDRQDRLGGSGRR